MKKALTIAALAAALLLTACSGAVDQQQSTPTPTPVTQAPTPSAMEREPSEEPQCGKLSKPDIESVKFAARNKKTDITDSAALPLPEDLQVFNGGLFTATWIFALKVETPDGETAIPIFAAEKDSVEFIGVNDDAIKHFHTLGGLTTEPGQPMQEYRDQLSESDEAFAVEACIEAAR
jgi:uncharacterized low-complexity protein